MFGRRKAKEAFVAFEVEAFAFNTNSVGVEGINPLDLALALSWPE
jgi:hypothetical protein